MKALVRAIERMSGCAKSSLYEPHDPAAGLSPENAAAQLESVLAELREKLPKVFHESLVKQAKEWIKTRHQKTHDTR